MEIDMACGVFVPYSPSVKVFSDYTWSTRLLDGSTVSSGPTETDREWLSDYYVALGELSDPSFLLTLDSSPKLE